MSWGLLLPWLSLPLAVGPLQSVLRARDDEALNRALVGTVQLQAAYAVLLIVGLLS
jgi:1,4-dihydroxy-2-naphthoate octaprenyltransferase